MVTKRHGTASIRVRLAVHHIMRWIKRNLVRIPTARGSNYAIDRSRLLKLVDSGIVEEDLQVGLAVKGAGGGCVYSGERPLQVFTSGRRFHAGWSQLFRYNRYRFHYNLSRLRDTLKRNTVCDSN